MMVLRSFLQRLESGFSDEQRVRVRGREAERLELESSHWSALRAMNVDLLMVREAHRSVSRLSSVRRADREGEWDLVSAQPGKLRSHAQSFRMGTHVEAAWDHATLRHRVAELVNDTRREAATDPVSAVARFIHAFVRAQPFLGQNERVVVVVASVLLRSLGLPALSRATERLPEFTTALVAEANNDLIRFVEATLWTEALALVEWLPAGASPRQTLADEHAALVSARVPIEIAPLADLIATGFEPLLGPPRSQIEHETFADRARAARDAAFRSHPICPQHSIVEARWSVNDERDAVLVVGLAGRGFAGATSAHFSVEHPRVVATAAPAILLPLHESADHRAGRLSSWTTKTVRRAGL